MTKINWKTNVYSMPPVKHPHVDMPTSMDKTTQEWEFGSSNEINRKTQSYLDALWGKNNIGDGRGVTNTRDICGYMCVFMEID